MPPPPESNSSETLNVSMRAGAGGAAAPAACHRRRAAAAPDQPAPVQHGQCSDGHHPSAGDWTNWRGVVSCTLYHVCCCTLWLFGTKHAQMGIIQAQVSPGPFIAILPGSRFAHGFFSGCERLFTRFLGTPLACSPPPQALRLHELTALLAAVHPQCCTTFAPHPITLTPAAPSGLAPARADGSAGGPRPAGGR